MTFTAEERAQWQQARKDRPTRRQQRKRLGNRQVYQQTAAAVQQNKQFVQRSKAAWKKYTNAVMSNGYGWSMVINDIWEQKRRAFYSHALRHMRTTIRTLEKELQHLLTPSDQLFNAEQVARVSVDLEIERENYHNALSNAMEPLDKREADMKTAWRASKKRVKMPDVPGVNGMPFLGAVV